MREYIRGGGYQAGATNQLIFNLKKKMSRKGQNDWSWKAHAIDQAARELKASITPSWLNACVLVPIPPSKVVGDPEYDDRMTQIAQLIAHGSGAQVREMLQQKASRDPAHATNNRRDVQALIANLALHAQCATWPAPTAIGVIDDVLTTGASFRACRTVLSKRYPDAHIVGFFVARRIIPESELPDGIFA